MNRSATIERRTRETLVRLTLHLDGPPAPAPARGPSAGGAAETPAQAAGIRTTLPFLDHMLHTLSCHGRFGLRVQAEGDTQVDPHHLIEDCGIALGQALLRALAGDFSGIERAGSFAFPMDGTLAVVALDLCGRPNLIWRVPLQGRPLGGLDPYLFREFFKGLVDASTTTVHVNVPYGDNDHHVIESVFKALGRALRAAITPLPDPGLVLSTKGVLGEAGEAS